MRLGWIIVCAVAVLCGTACGGKKPRATVFSGQVISISDSTLAVGGFDTLRFGRLRSGEIALMQLQIHSTSHQPVVLRSSERSCGCVDLSYQNQPITPTQPLPISVSFDSRGERGWQLKTLDLYFSGAQRPLRLFIESEVE